jgi:hypothetical protein
MPVAITRLLPQVILLAVVGYWSWPSLQQAFSKPALPPAESKKAAETTEFSAASLSPTFPPPPTRNLFGPPGAMVTGKGRKGGIPDAKELAEKVAADTKDAGLVLKATCIIGEQRLAFINGRVYKEKEVIQGQGEEPLNWIITDILPHKVLLSCQGMPLQLSYPNVFGKKAPAATTPAAGKSGKSTTKKRSK